jgi:hypothetical protein
MLERMTVTTLRVSAETRDQLAAVAQTDFGGVTAENAIQRLLDEHVQLRSIQIMDAYREQHPDGWIDYLVGADADSGADAELE